MNLPIHFQMPVISPNPHSDVEIRGYVLPNGVFVLQQARCGAHDITNLLHTTGTENVQAAALHHVTTMPEFEAYYSTKIRCASDLLAVKQWLAIRAAADWVPFTGEYEKEEYDIKLASGEVLYSCWPNAGYWNAPGGRELAVSEAKYVRRSAPMVR